MCGSQQLAVTHFGATALIHTAGILTFAFAPSVKVSIKRENKSLNTIMKSFDLMNLLKGSPGPQETCNTLRTADPVKRERNSKLEHKNGEFGIKE